MRAPGPFAFADKDKLAAVLAESGWTDIGISPLDTQCTMPESDLVGVFTRLGPVGAAYDQADARMREQIVATVRPAFDRFVRDGVVSYTAACWSACAVALGA